MPSIIAGLGAGDARNFEAVDKASADMAKIIFDDGDVVFVNMRKPIDGSAEKSALGAWRG